MKTHHCNYRQAAIAIALALWLAWAAGCTSTNTGPTLPAPIPVELEQVRSANLTLEGGDILFCRTGDILDCLFEIPAASCELGNEDSEALGFGITALLGQDLGVLLNIGERRHSLRLEHKVGGSILVNRSVS